MRRCWPSLHCVDWVVVFGDRHPACGDPKHCGPNVLAKGGDWKLAEIVGRREVESWGGRVVRLRQIPAIRTTALAAQIAKRGGRPARRTPGK